MSAERTARQALVRGRVQGVGFRWSTQEKARALGVQGWVRNLMDGRVEVHVEGHKAPVDAMLEWLARGPRPARVDHLDVREIDFEGHASFEVRSTGHGDPR